MEVKPFKAFRFNKTVVGDVGSCIAPPYDVISADQQQQLYEKNEYNIVRIIKGKKTASDDDNSNEYTRAADYLDAWLKKGILKQDTDEAIYAYVQNFKALGMQFQRSSFIALAKLEEFGPIVRPHETTLSKPKADRLNLQKATGAKFGLIFMLYEDKQLIADKIIERTISQKPLVDFLDEQNIRHRFFAITAEDDINAVTKMMGDKSCIIADGHHRYETALNYYKQTHNPAAAYQMLAFANTQNQGLIVLATHRLVMDLENFDAENLIANLQENFEITKYEFDSPNTKTDAKRMMLTQMKDQQAIDKNAFGVYLGDNAFYTAILKSKQLMDSVVPDKSEAWKLLDVSVLHKLILQELLGIDEKKLAAGHNIEYVKDTKNAIDDSIDKVDQRKKQAAFFMNAVKMQQLKRVTDLGEKMPQKSTYFFPKVYTGLTICKL